MPGREYNEPSDVWLPSEYLYRRNTPVDSILVEKNDFCPAVFAIVATEGYKSLDSTTQGVIHSRRQLQPYQVDRTQTNGAEPKDTSRVMRVRARRL